jgi:cell wall-associated NlpC family hydrolase
MKKVKLLYAAAIITVCVITIHSCKKDKPKNGEVVAKYTDLSLSDEEEKFLASLPHTNYTYKDVTLPNGENLDSYIRANYPEMLSPKKSNKITNASKVESAQKTKLKIITDMTYKASLLSARSTYSIADEGTNQPAQPNGLAYVWGSKDPTVRKTGSSSSGGKCSKLLYGLDCSGFIDQLAKSAGLNINFGNNSTGTAVLKNADSWNTAIKASGHEKLKMEDYKPGTLAKSQLESGDIIYWSSHIGIIVMVNGEPTVYNSAGNKDLDCDASSGAKRGPVQIPLKDIETYWGSGFKNWGILRMTIQISGKWTFYMKCQGMTTDLFNLNLDFPVQDNNTFTLTKTATDYDGSTNNFTFVFKYDKATNKLSCTYSMDDSQAPGFKREDTFSVQLYTDDTGYINAKNTSMVNGSGCTEAIRLVNQEI